MSVQNYGMTISGDQVYALTAPAKHGRSGSHKLFIGYVTKVGRQWKHDQSSTLYATQSAAAKMLWQIVCG
jgi:hypothetical protein